MIEDYIDPEDADLSDPCRCACGRLKHPDSARCPECWAEYADWIRDDE